MAPLIRFSFVLLLQVVVLIIVVNVVVVVQGQKHDAYRTCAIRQNEIVTLIYNSIQNMYVPLNNENDMVNTTTSSSTTGSNSMNNDTYNDQNNDDNNNNNTMKNDTSTRRRTNRRRLTMNMDTILNDSLSISSSSPSSSILSPWYVRWMNQVVGTVTDCFDGMIDTYYNNAGIVDDVAEPAMAVPTTLSINQIQVPREASGNSNHYGSRRLQLSSSSSGFQYRADSDRIHHIDPNIVLHEPYDGRMVDVRVCDCSIAGTWNNNNNYRDAFNVNYTFYCPINKSYCYVPRIRKWNPINGSIYQQYPYYYHPVCISAPTVNAEITVSIIRPMALASLLLLIVVCLISPIGQHVVRGCCCRFLLYCRYCLYCCRHQQGNPTNNNNDNKNSSYNQYYSNYLLQNKPKIVERYVKLYIQERQDRWNVRYQQLQQLHGELPKNDNDENDIIFNNNTNNDGCNTNNGIHPPLDGLEESIVRDIYYYRPSLLLRTRIYKGLQQISTSSSTTTTTVLTTATTSTIKSTISSPYDLDDDKIILNVDYTIDHQDDNIPIGNSNSNRNNNNNNDTIITKATSSDNDGGCIICFAPIDIGCKVGVLPECQHVFHSRCLKVWLKQRNVCPLCLTTDVAIVAYSYKSSYDHHPIEEQQVESEEDQQQQNTTITSSPMSSSTTLLGVDSTYP